MTRKRSSYRPRPVHIPVTKELHDQTALVLHMGYAVLERGPDEDVLDQFRDIFNMVGLAISGDARFVEEMAVINAGAEAVAEGKLDGVLAAVNTIDAMLPRMDVMKMEMAIRRLRAIK